MDANYVDDHVLGMFYLGGYNVNYSEIFLLQQNSITS